MTHGELKFSLCLDNYNSNEIIKSGYMTKYKKISLPLILIVLLSPMISFGQCNTDDFLDKCASNLGTFNYIKSFNINASPRKRANSEYSYVFSKGSTYKVIVCNENVVGGEMLIGLYDRNHNLIASTYNEKSNKYYSELQYPCSATGVYYIKATFKGAKRGCGMFLLGFSRDQ
jgi:hypothetical protein